MLCSICGEICRCPSKEDSKSLPRWLPDENLSFGVTEPRKLPDEPAALERSDPDPGANSGNGGPVADPNDVQEDSAAWRQELAVRLNRYHSRRKPRPPRYPSLRLRFEEQGSASHDRVPEPSATPKVMPVVSNHALAFDPFEEVSPREVVDSPSPLPVYKSHESMDQPCTEQSESEAVAFAPTAKIIEFPRFWTPPTPARDELADAVVERPRILDVPDFVPAAPALGGITIEPVEQPELEKRPGIDIPLQGAALSRRVVSAAIDACIIATHCALFGFIFWKLTAVQPPSLEIAAVLGGLWIVLWSAYQYLFMVYGGSTPGLRLAGLKMVRFDGSRASQKLRRWRVLASFLSAFSLGMGYAWVFLDEDSLCWHDRITHTYLEERIQRTGD
jgi:uncharacterized RDD family membrane protein YckC